MRMKPVCDDRGFSDSTIKLYHDGRKFRQIVMLSVPFFVLPVGSAHLPIVVI